ncbi:MAG: VCBS repeat-containing protein [Clostridiaceae bacterium]|nr:VCBS repeat-containing protein [Clostridiaceae bacterium]
MFNSMYRAGMQYPNVVAFVRGDVNGDKVIDNIYLTGTRTPTSPFVQNITLLIQDGRTGVTTSVPLKENAGYDPTLLLADFTGDGVKDIQIGIASGGSGGTMYYYIYSYINNIPRLIFDFNLYNELFKYEVTYKDDYKVEFISRQNNERYIIDLTYKGTEYLNEIYDKNGKLREPIEGFVNPISGLYPIDFDSNGVYELLAYQRIAGRYNADAIGYVQNTLKWNGTVFMLSNQNVAIFGKQV